jgi:NADH-quinone oxidoreductase subunit G
MVKILINNKETEVENGLTVLQVLEQNGVQIPKFCYHEKLKIAGNCRMCLVEISPGPPKPQASCAINVSEGMSVKTNTEMVKKAREGVMEFLLANHPLDCPICDQAGECDLQDQAFIYGKGSSRFLEEKRAVEEKSMGPFVKTQMTRCIHCTRCVRFMEDIAGTAEIGAFNRGNEVEIATFVNQSIKSELSGNITDLCPVGALTAKPYALSYRSWELKKINSIDVFDSLCASISVQSKNNEVVRVLPVINEDINEEWISDKSRFAVDGLLNQRLDSCYIKNQKTPKPSSFDDALDVIKKKLQSIDLSKQFAAITGDFTDLETTFALKEFMQKIGSPFGECRQKDINLNISKRENYLFNSQIVGIEEADLIVIVNSNIKKESPVLNARIRRNVVERNVPIITIGENVDLNYSTHHLGDDKSSLKSKELQDALLKAKKPLLIAGLDAFLGDDGAIIHNTLLELSEQYLQKENWNGFNVLHQNASLASGFDAKLIYPGGASEILSKAQNGEIKVLYLLGSDEIDISNLKNTFIIYQGSHGDKIAPYADVIISTTAYTEKVATFTNTEGKRLQTSKAVSAIGDAKNDVDIIKLIAQCLNIELTLNLDQVFETPKLELKQSKEGQKFTLSKNSFYMSDYISRNSPSMAKAKKEFE